jgi:RNA polymerase sigma factor (sigma-70 family)
MGEERSDEPRDQADSAIEEGARLVTLIAAGDRDAECRFVERYQPRIRAMVMARTRSADAAADLTQDVLMEALCALRRGQLREAAKLSPFVLGIARNLLKGYFRGQARQPEPLDFPDQLPDLRRPPIELEERREDAAMRAIASLELLDRTILHLTLLEGMKPGAIAERLQLSSDVVRQRKLRATRRVIDLVKGEPSQKAASIHLVTGRE